MALAFVAACATTAGAQASVPLIVSRAAVDPGEEIGFHAMLAPDTVFVGQQATYQIAVFLRDPLRSRLRRNPEFVPPDLRSIVAYDLPASATRTFQRNVGGATYEAHVIERAFFGLAPGTFTIPPAVLSYSLPLSASFFSREESFSLRSESRSLVVLDVPQDGRPPEYEGAVGAYRIEARLDSTEGRVGDPFVLTLAVSGEGNVNLLPRPRVAVPWAHVVASTERVTLDANAARISGRKEFDWIVTPKRAGTMDFGDVRYPYFDPDRRRYEFAIVHPPAVQVDSGVLVAVDSIAERPVLAIRSQYRGEAGPTIAERPTFWAMILFAPAPALLALVTGRRRRARPLPRGIAALRRLTRRPDASVMQVRRAYVDALAMRLGTTAESLTTRGALARSLRLSGVPPEQAQDAERLLVELDTAVYSLGGSLPAPRETARRALTIARTVDRTAIRYVVRAMSMLLAVVCVVGTAIAAANAAAPQEQFTRGVTLYRAGAFTAAARTFKSVTDLAPRSADAWANLGTAAWAVGDSAGAAVGWQRALRLEPRAEEIRDRLSLLATPEPTLDTDVPPVTASEAEVAAGIMWLALWIAAALSLRRVRRGDLAMSRLTFVSLLLAVAGLSGGAFHIQRVHDGRGVAVVTGMQLLRSDPTFGSESEGQVTTGEVARVGAQRGVWTRITVGTDRAGWIESARLVPLDIDAP